MADVTWRPVDSFCGNWTTEALLQYRPCPVCTSLRQRPIAAQSDFQFFSDSSAVPKRVDIRHVQCRDCFALFMNPCYSPYGFQILFAEAGKSYGAGAGRADQQVSWLHERQMLEPGQAVLDIGCYDGDLLGRLPNHVRKLGVDIDLAAIKRGRERLSGQDVELVHGDFESFELMTVPDTIIMLHVLEHLARPVEVLRKLRSLAHPGTRLVIEVPIIENGATNDVSGFFTWQHLTHFSRRSLSNCVTQAGWRVVEWQEQPDYNGCRVTFQSSESPGPVTGDPQDVTQAARSAANWHEALADIGNALAATGDARRVILWGAGMHTEYLYQLTSLFQTAVEREYVLIDSDPDKQGTTWRGISIARPEALATLDGDAPVILSTYGSQEEIAAAATTLNVDAQRLIRLYDRVNTY